MLSTLTKIKNMPIWAVIGSLASASALIGAMFTLDARYAHAADVEKENVRTQQLVQMTSQTLRKQMLEDKVFELDAKKAQTRDQKLPPVEAALYERYKRQLAELTFIPSSEPAKPAK